MSDAQSKLFVFRVLVTDYDGRARNWRFRKPAVIVRTIEPVYRVPIVAIMEKLELV